MTSALKVFVNTDYLTPKGCLIISTTNSLKSIKVWILKLTSSGFLGAMAESRGLVHQAFWKAAGQE